MATTRNVFGNIKDFIAGNVVRSTIQFDFTGSYDSDSNYIRGTVYVKTDDLGDFNVDLLATDDIVKTARYTCTLPSGESFFFGLPVGDGLPINLVTLRELGWIGVFTDEENLNIDGTIYTELPGTSGFDENTIIFVAAP